MQRPILLKRTDRLKEQLEGRLPYWRPADGTGNFAAFRIRDSYLPEGTSGAVETNEWGCVIRVMLSATGAGIAVFGAEFEGLGWVQFFTSFQVDPHRNGKYPRYWYGYGELVAVSVGTQEIPLYNLQREDSDIVEATLRLDLLEQPLEVEVPLGHPLWTFIRSMTHMTGALGEHK